MIKREQYLNKLKKFKDKDIIKVITGIRRCGKSTLFKLYIDYLYENNISKEQIININFEDLQYEELLDYKKLYNYIMGKIENKNKYYIFLDEIQNVTQFEKVVDSLFIKDNIDVYITGSNSKFMSGELATLLSGRYIEIKMLPLSFKEYYDVTSNKETSFRNYLMNSSFPYTLKLKDKEEVFTYLDGLYNTIIIKDVVERYKIQDISKFNSFIKFMFSNISNVTSAKKISDTMTSMNRKISPPTIETFLEIVTNSLLMYKVSRYDIKGKEYLKLLDKYYLSDVGLRYYLLGNKSDDYGNVLENIVFLELIRRGYKVYVGKTDTLEVDFVAIDIENNTSYIQVSASVVNEKTLERELKSLLNINDHNPKLLLTMDNVNPVDHNGIKQIYLLDWLLK
ncbi:MAG: ATP-binding protein [bacterium]